MRNRFVTPHLYNTLLATLVFSTAIFAKDEKIDPTQKVLAGLKQELSALESLKAEKLETLQKAEATRWENRYKQSTKAKEAEEKARALEDKYSRLSADVGRLEEELIKAQNESKDKEGELQAAKASWENFNVTVKQTINNAAENLAIDIPVGIDVRTLGYSKATQIITATNPDTRAALDLYLQTSLQRYTLTTTQSLTTKQTLFASGRSANAWRLQLGTIFIAELEKGGKDESQILLRTGNLQGKTFVWRSDLAQDYNRLLNQSIQSAVQGKNGIELPLDVLQYKSVGSGFVQSEKQSFGKIVTTWFKEGGVTLYPLVAVGLLALLMILERFFYFARRSTNAESFMAKFLAFAKEKKWKEANALCKDSSSSLAHALGAIVEHVDESREAAEKAVREALLREVPALEKRLPLIAAMGAAAPLLGLLGTVSGLITLFKILNQLGANDPKVLAGGISEALINTETGLAIAIPVLLIHGFLNEKLDTLQATLNSCSLEVLNKIWPEK